MTLSIPQLHLLRSLDSQGWADDLHSILLVRCGATQDDWQKLVEAEFVRKHNGRWSLTGEGRREYNRQKKNRYF